MVDGNETKKPKKTKISTKIKTVTSSPIHTYSVTIHSVIWVLSVFWPFSSFSRAHAILIDRLTCFVAYTNLYIFQVINGINIDLWVENCVAFRVFKIDCIKLLFCVAFQLSFNSLAHFPDKICTSNKQREFDLLSNGSI